MSRSKRIRLTDPTLKFLYSKMREENASKPPSERIGFQAYCRKHGILAPEDIQAIERFEIPFSEVGYEEEDVNA